MTKRYISTKRSIIIGTLLLLLLGLGLRLPGLLAKGEDTEVAPASRVLPVETLKVEMLEAYRVSRTYTGQIEARRTSDLGFERAGKLVAIAVEEGERVTEGASLATLDTQALHMARRELLAQRTRAAAQLDEMLAGPRAETIAAARAQVHELRQQLALAKLRRTRRQELLVKGVIAQEAFDEADVGAKTLLARLDAAQRRLDELLAGTRREQIRAQKAWIAQLDARLAALAIDLEKSVLKAPYAGTVAARRVDEGTAIMAGQPILRLIEDAHLEARVGTPPRVAATLTPGSDQRVQVGQEMYGARVTALLPELDASTRTVTVVLTLDAAAIGKVVPGQVVRLRIEETVATAGFWLPTTALTKGERGLWACYALVEERGGARQSLPDGTTIASIFRTERRDVEILHTENDRVFVRGILQPGELIVKSGTHRLVAAQLVRPAAQL